jgi:hypothetical protein
MKLRQQKFVEWVEPFHPDHTDITLIHRLTVEDAIKAFRATRPKFKGSDADALDDFMAVHWAVLVQDTVDD